MPGQFYDNALQTQHEDFTPFDIAGAGSFSFYGPGGRAGRILDLTIEITTALTVADSNIDAGRAAGAENESLDDFLLAFTGSAIGDLLTPNRDNTAVSLEEGDDIIVDEETTVLSDGGSTAGAGNLRVLVAWW